MSRPFSYNDDNFTVIGNLLFCHIKLTKDYKAHEPIVELPPAIYDRLLYHTYTMRAVTVGLEQYGSGAAQVGVKNVDKKYYLDCANALASINYLVGFYYLKDI